VFDRNHGAFAVLRGRGDEVEVLAPEEGTLSRLAFMRIAREHVLSRLLGLPGMLLHASAFVMDRQAALIIGEKRSGKTSLLLHSLSGGICVGKGETGGTRSVMGAGDPDGRIQYLANDRVWVSDTPGRFMARGFPTISSLRVSGLGFFPDIAERLRESTWASTLTLKEARRPRARRSRPWNGRTYALTPLQLCRALDVEPVAEAQIGALLFPRVTGASGRIRVTPLTRGVAANFVERGLFRAGAEQKAGGLFAARGFPRRLNPDETWSWIQKLVRRVPSYSLDLGLQAYSDTKWVSRLEAKIAAQGSFPD